MSTWPTSVNTVDVSTETTFITLQMAWLLSHPVVEEKVIHSTFNSLWNESALLKNIQK